VYLFNLTQVLRACKMSPAMRSTDLACAPFLSREAGFLGAKQLFNGQSS
jgi:hypothetical protein